MSKDEETEDEIIASETAARHLWHKGVFMAKAKTLPHITIDGVVLTPAQAIVLRVAVQVTITQLENGELGPSPTLGTLQQINNLLCGKTDASPSS